MRSIIMSLLANCVMNAPVACKQIEYHIIYYMICYEYVWQISIWTVDTHLHNICCVGAVVICVALVVVRLDNRQPGLAHVLIDVQRGEDIKAAEHLHAQI